MVFVHSPVRKDQNVGAFPDGTVHLNEQVFYGLFKPRILIIYNRDLHRPEAFLLKIIFTAVTLGAGFKGGEIVPVFFTGATFGCVAAPLLGLHPSFGAGLGMVSLFCGVTNCPVTSLLLAVELFAGDSPGLLTGHSLGLFAASIGVSFMLSGYYGLYNGQKFAFSKLRHEPINLRANEHTER